jgi:hypothetical protein
LKGAESLCTSQLICLAKCSQFIYISLKFPTHSIPYQLFAA